MFILPVFFNAITTTVGFILKFLTFVLFTYSDVHMKCYGVFWSQRNDLLWEYQYYIFIISILK